VTETVNCNGANSAIVSALSCTIPVSVLRAAPFSLPWGTNVFAKVIATNSKGNSTESNFGNGAIITTTPDAPINVLEDITKRTATTLGLTWTQAAFNGGAVIIDYRVSIAETGGSFSIMASNIITSSYTATGLTSGITYLFKI
jgi:hypothetical protein